MKEIMNRARRGGKNIETIHELQRLLHIATEALDEIRRNSGGADDDCGAWGTATEAMDRLAPQEKGERRG